MRRLILSSALASALAFAAPPLLAQVYKWVDEKGVVNYSNEAPANAKATQLDPKASRLSIIGTDDALTQARVPSANESALAEKIDRLERKLDAERYVRGAADAQVQAAADSWYQQCLRDRRVDCDYAGMDPYYSAYGPYYGYWPVVATKRHSFRNQVMHHRPIAAPRQGGRAAFAPARSVAAARQM
ncbi:MAG TPA: DUF4124 domain-containing protein [Burkholderiales bacterium]|nr:DUF4124 domain-containing protein [Burkholderiales bacterium]